MDQIDAFKAEEERLIEKALREKESSKSDREKELETTIVKQHENIKLLTQKMEQFKANAQQGIDKLK